MQPPTKHLLYM